ncbi:MAG TPA: carbonic anhydrase [Xanthobacteraceae bacterium]|jgi:carbonic anhydrase|nr:carbonic anhydrase [Xanthobacteraceae bacterium]
MSFPDRLIDGYRDFVKTRLPLERSRFEKLAASGQRPEVMVICCCDSRVSPEVIFDAHPGELFVVRNVANLVPPYSPSGFTHGVSAALEFAVQGLEVKYIVVMGHTHCGGIRAYSEHRNRLNPGDFIDNWMSLIAPAAEALGETGDGADYVGRLERASIIVTLDNLLTFPWIKSRVEERQLQLIGAYFDVGTGHLAVYDRGAGAFAALSGENLPSMIWPVAE